MSLQEPPKKNTLAEMTKKAVKLGQDDGENKDFEFPFI
jgi:hypothetical protein